MTSSGISKCSNQTCSCRDQCYRHTAPEGEMQSYALFIPDIDTLDEFECKWFRDNRQRAKE